MSGSVHDSDAPSETVAGLAVAAVDRLATAVDDLVPEVASVANDVLSDVSRTTRWAGLLFGICAAALAPWIVVIAVTLPARELSPNYDIAWAGFDVMLLIALSCTAGSALRRSRNLAMTASWSTALLVTDAWFDMMTAPGGRDLVEAVIMALLVELPLAATCVWLTRHSQDIADRRLTLLLRKLRS